MNNFFLKNLDKSIKGKWCENLSKPVAADMIGTPDPISNLRPVKYYIPPNETSEVKDRHTQTRESLKLNCLLGTRLERIMSESGCI